MSSQVVEGRVKEVIVDSRINKVLAMRTDSVAMLEALDAISEFYVSNTVEARRALRQDLELQNINLGKKFLVEFDQVRQRIESVEEYSVQLEKECQLLASRVTEADENMKTFMEKASELENRRNYFTEQSKEIGQFLNRFQLSEDEIDILYKAPIDSPGGARSFFDSLQRLRTAYADCKVMVEKHCYSAGFELLDILGQHQDKAYQRLFEWVKGKCDNLAETGTTDDIDIMLQTAIRYLRKLPIYFSQCQDLVVNSRRTQLVQKFVVALTQGGTSGQVFRAIDLHAHDAVRYVGDMLAWMHQAVASEEEFLQAVFGDQTEQGKGQSLSTKGNAIVDSSQSGSEPVDANSSSAEPGGLSVSELLARCLQGLGRPLRIRIMQSLETRSGLEVLYTLTDLLFFYEITFNRIVPIENSVHSAIKGCLGECRRLFLSGLNKQADVLTQSPSSYPLDLAASHATRECCRQIQEILRVQSAALSPLPSDPSDSCFVDTVLGGIITPLLQACRTGGQSLTQGDMAIFMLNNVSAILNELREAAKRNESESIRPTASSSSNWLDLLNTEASTWIGVLVAEEVGRTLRRSDMDKLLELMDVIPAGMVASQQQGLSQDRVGTVMRSFYASLFSTVAPHFERLQDPDLREATRRQTAETIAGAHAKTSLKMAALAAKLITFYEEQVSLLQKQIKELKSFAKDDKKAEATAEKAAHKGQQRKKEPVDPNRPKRAPSAYLLFMADQQGPFKAAHPDMSQVEIMTSLGKKWGTLSAGEKASFEKRAATLKADFQRKMLAYNSAKAGESSSSNGAVIPAPITTAPTTAEKPKKKMPILPPTATQSTSSLTVSSNTPAKVNESKPPSSEKSSKKDKKEKVEKEIKKEVPPASEPAEEKKKEKKRKHEETDSEPTSEKKKHHKKGKKE